MREVVADVFCVAGQFIHLITSTRRMLTQTAKIGKTENLVNRKNMKGGGEMVNREAYG